MNEQQIQRLRYLFSRYVNSLSTRAEYDEFLEITADSESDPELRSLLSRLWDELEQQQPQQQAIVKQLPNLIRKLLPYGIAASILIAAAITYYAIHQDNGSTEGQMAEQLAPLQKGISLKLASGQTIQLSKHYTGRLTGTTATQQNSSLSYQNQTSATTEEKNTLTNNGHEKFMVRLSDGTEATLDIGSSLTYPTAFNHPTREVTLTGQGYFKVKHENTRFLVHYNRETTEDIGTQFNINAYPNETAVATLIEGQIKVNDKILKPGQQSQNNEIASADIEAVTAWLQDKYIFEKEPLERIMQWVSRIYGVKVIYQDERLKHMVFTGSFNRKKKLGSVLNFFRQTGGADFKVEDQTITVFESKMKK